MTTRESVGSRRREVLLAALCAAATLVTFLPVRSFPFLLLWDDGYGVADNRHLSFDASGLWWIFTNLEYSHWHPLTWLSLAADRVLWGHAPWGYHVTNLLIHSVNAALVFLLARLLLQPHGKGMRLDGASAFAALLWALHPLRVEPVAWISERRGLLAAMFALSAVIAYIRGAQEGDGKSGDAWRKGALILGMAAMSSKVTAVTLPAALIVLDVRLRGGPRWREKLVWLIPATTALACNIVAQGSKGAVSWENFGPVPRLAQAVFGLGFYPFKTIMPTQISPHYQYTLLLEPMPFMLAAIGIGSAAAGVWAFRRRLPGVIQAAAAYVVLILPLLGLFKSGRITVADRYSYMASIPLALLAGGVFLRAADKRGVRIAGALIILLAAGLSRHYLPVWSSEVALWRRSCTIFPDSFFPRFKLSQAEEAAGLDGAVSDYARAGELHRMFFARMATARELWGDALGAAEARRRSEGPLNPSRFSE